jgi:hypothetical protein
MKRIENIFEDNRTVAAQLRDEELAIVAEKIRPIDLRTIPREQWDKYLDFQLTVPEHLLDAVEGGPLDADTLRALDEAVERFHGITAPYYVTTTASLQHQGRGWSYVPEAAEFLTGFVLDKEDDK